MSAKQAIKFLYLLIVTIIFATESKAQQASTEVYGQNRVQVRKMDWQYYDTTHFRILFYDYGKYNAQFLMQQAEADLPAIVFMMGAKLPGKIDVVVYNSFTDYKQTNIGRYNEEMSIAQNGIVDVNRNTIVVYFDGTHDGLRKQIRKGIAKIIKDNILFGFSLKDIVQNAVKMNLPTWYTNGYVQYVSEDWDADKNAKLKSIITKNTKLKFEDLAYEEPTLLGHSFYNFVAVKYNQSAINNLLFLTRSRKPINSAIATVFKKSAKEVFTEWKLFYNTPNDSLLTDSTAARKNIAILKAKTGASLKNFSVSPDGSVIAYTQIKDGMYNINIYTVSNKKSATIIEGGIRSSIELKDPNYPILSWSIDGKKLAIMYEKDYYQRLKIYDSKKGRVIDRIITKNKFDRIQNMCFMEDDDKMIMSCIKKGQCDLYVFTIKNARLTQLTKDIWDDINPTYIHSNGKDGILFMSNRPYAALQAPIRNDQLPNLPFQIYYLPTGSGALVKCSNNINVKMSSAIQYGNNQLAFLADENFKNQRYIINLTKTESGKDSAYYILSNPIDYNIMQQNYSATKNTVTDIVNKKGEYYIYNTPITTLEKYDLDNGALIVNKIESKKIKEEKEINKKNEDVYFLSEFENDIDSLDISKPKKDALAYDESLWKPKRFKAKPYLPTFSTDYLQTTLDNSLLFNKYQLLDMNNGQFKYPPLGALLRLSLMDALEDYKISGGIRVPINFSPTIGYLIRFANYRKRLDWELTFYHNADTIIKNNSQLPTTNAYYSPNPVYTTQAQNYLQCSFTYPLSITTSYKFLTGFRNDQLRYKARDEYSLKFTTQNEYWWFNRLEYVYDNTIQPIKNISKGTKVKFYADGFLKLNGSGNMFAIGFDARNYLGLYKNIILASRISGAGSGGKNRMLYRLGGIDNEVAPNANQTPILDTTVSYGYQTTVTNMRGYAQNARNGSTYLILNEEIRVPVMNTITKKQIKNKMLKELQLVGFVDAGSAWTGFLSNAEDFYYPLYSTNNNVRVTSLQKVGATMFGYGFGFRTSLFGYYINTNIGWNIDRRVPRASIGLMTDF